VHAGVTPYLKCSMESPISCSVLEEESERPPDFKGRNRLKSNEKPELRC